MTNPPEAAVRVCGRPEIVEAEGAAHALARAVGFAMNSCDEIAIVARELASNLVRHTHGGELRVRAIHSETGHGIQLESEDEGPGIADVELALRDGYSTAGGLGTGLGAVNRLMDQLEVHARPQGGTHLICQRWLRPGSSALAARWLQFGVATRARRHAAQNGDAFIVRQWEGAALAGVIDGLGHGLYAQRAAQAARQYLDNHFDQPLENLFRGTGRACSATRGVVMALARFEPDLVSIASVGNIETRLLGSSTRASIVVRRGIVGLNAPQPVITQHAWDDRNLLVMHSDGVRALSDRQLLSAVHPLAPALIAQRLLVDLGRNDDDATVVVARKTST